MIFALLSAICFLLLFWFFTYALHKFSLSKRTSCIIALFLALPAWNMRSKIFLWEMGFLLMVIFLGVCMKWLFKEGSKKQLWLLLLLFLIIVVELKMLNDLNAEERKQETMIQIERIR